MPASPYCQPSDLVNYLPAQVINLATSAQQTQACADASEEADSYMRGRYQLPLLAVGSDVKRFTAWIACYLLATMVGYAPQPGAADRIRDRYYQAVGWPDRPGTGWFPGVQRQAIHPDVTPSVAQPGDTTHDLPQVFSNPQRGWQQFSGGKPVIS